LIGLIDNDEKVVFSKKKNIPNSRPGCKNQTLFMIKMAKIDTLFMTKTADKPCPLGPHILLWPIKGCIPAGLHALVSEYQMVFSYKDRPDESFIFLSNFDCQL